MQRVDLEGLKFVFGNNIGDIYCEQLELLPESMIGGYQHPNENSWDIDGGCLVFRNLEGEVTTNFGSSWYDDSQQIFRGKYEDRASYWHFLKRIDEDRQTSVVISLREELYSQFTPFQSTSISYIDNGYCHTNLSPKLVASVLDVIRPHFWLEIGSMIGGSAILTANVVKEKQLPTEIICIDPFIGDVNMWMWEKELKEKDEWSFLRLENGRPTILDRFLANVVAAGHSDIVLPIITTSTVGIKLLKCLFAEGRVTQRPTVIYLDSAHEAGETLLELKASWDLLEPGGVLFGDDWSWEAVRNDVTNFASSVELNQELSNRLIEQHGSLTSLDGILLDEGQWLLVK